MEKRKKKERKKRAQITQGSLKFIWSCLSSSLLLSLASLPRLCACVYVLTDVRSIRGTTRRWTARTRRRTGTRIHEREHAHSVIVLYCALRRLELESDQEFSHENDSRNNISRRRCQERLHLDWPPCARGAVIDLKRNNSKRYSGCKRRKCKYSIIELRSANCGWDFSVFSDNSVRWSDRC